MSQSPDQDRYIQPSLAGFEEEMREETLLEHVVVETLPTLKQRKKGVEWDCQVYAPPDIFNQERSVFYEVHARSYAREAKKKNLRPGDIVTLTGVQETQEIELADGSKQTINHITVSNIDVLSRAKRTSITVYERRRGR